MVINVHIVVLGVLTCSHVMNVHNVVFWVLTCSHEGGYHIYFREICQFYMCL